MKTVRALVVDDSRVMRSVVMQSLRKSNLAEFQFIEADDGLDALNKFDAGAIDIAFVDWNMPKMSGIDFVRTVRADPQNADLPIVMVTSEKAIDRIREALDTAGANAYICKPFTVDDLTQALRRFIDPMGGRKVERFFSGLAERR